MTNSTACHSTSTSFALDLQLPTASVVSVTVAEADVLVAAKPVDATLLAHVSNKRLQTVGTCTICVLHRQKKPKWQNNSAANPEILVHQNYIKANSLALCAQRLVHFFAKHITAVESQAVAESENRCATIWLSCCKARRE